MKNVKIYGVNEIITINRSYLIQIHNENLSNVYTFADWFQISPTWWRSLSCFAVLLIKFQNVYITHIHCTYKNFLWWTFLKYFGEPLCAWKNRMWTKSRRVFVETLEFLSLGNEYQTREVAIRRARRRLFTPWHYSLLRLVGTEKFNGAVCPTCSFVRLPPTFIA